VAGSQPSRPAAAASRPADPPREKKTTDLTPAAAVDPAPQDASAERAAETADQDTAAPLPANALGVWRQAADAVGGLAADFAAEATAAAWRGQMLDVTIPATAATAVTFLRRPEAVASLGAALTNLVGRSVRHAVVVEAAAAAVSETAGATSAAAEPSRPRPVASQAALVREASEHPLVAHARTVLDAAIRKVEPARPRPAPDATQATAVATAPDHSDDEAEPDTDDARGAGEADG
jgi:hypothetical protein